MENLNPAIIIIAYNRPESLARLLRSIAEADYANRKNITLVISIDYHDSKNHEKVITLANEFKWAYGEKQVIKHEFNLGLRKHVISCGNLTEEYDAIIMLEDDIYVSTQFYNYSLQMLTFYYNEDYIAGISLYKHGKNVNVNRPFYPQDNGYDVFFMQFAQSWGQCWTRRMWKEFYVWYKENQVLVPEDDIPEFVSGWPNSSWLKYYIKYVIKENKYFVYPYISLSTNFGDSGTNHRSPNNNDMQIPLQFFYKDYKIPKYNKAIKYDAFFEREDLGGNLEIKGNNVCVDLYFSKKNKKKERYWLTTSKQPYKIVKTYGLNFKPHEINIILNNFGNDIFLYDTKYKIDRATKGKDDFFKIFLYDYTNIPMRYILKYFSNKILNKIKCLFLR